jgi:hypothetical protein
MIENFDPNTIEDESLRHVFTTLMNLVENLTAKVQEQAEEIQRLRDENNRLKGEQGKPSIPRIAHQCVYLSSLLEEGAAGSSSILASLRLGRGC